MSEFIDTYAVVVVVVILMVFTGIFLILIFYATIHRSVLKRRDRLYLEAEERIQTLIYEYLDGGIKRKDFSDNLRSRHDVSAAYSLINIMIDNMTGMENKSLRSLLDLPKFKRYYLKMLRSRKIMNLAKACMYFSQKGLRDKSTIRKLYALQEHQYNVIVYASTLALVNSSNQAICDQALIRFLQHKGNASMAISDIIFKYHSNHKDKEASAQVLRDVVKDSGFPDKTRAAVIRMFPNLGFFQLSGDLLEMLRSISQKDGNGIMTSVLVWVLHELAVEELEDEIRNKRLWESSYQPVRLQVARFLSEHEDSEWVDMLLHLAHDPDLEVRIAAQKVLAGFKNSINVRDEQFETDILPEWIEMKRSGEGYVDSL